jgi:hypothetical protein
VLVHVHWNAYGKRRPGPNWKHASVISLQELREIRKMLSTSLSETRVERGTFRIQRGHTHSTATAVSSANVDTHVEKWGRGFDYQQGQAHLRRIRQANGDTCLVTPAHPSVCPHETARLSQKGICNILYLGFPLKCFDTFRFCLKLDTSNRHFTWIPACSCVSSSYCGNSLCSLLGKSWGLWRSKCLAFCKKRPRNTTSCGLHV